MEDYKKKYEDALERMKSWARGEHPECFTEAQKTAEFIFPELKESKDERIRKGIFKALSKKDARDVLISQGIEVSDALAWLEKQGELRSTDKEEPTDYNSIDPCFGKPIDKREPKFNVGDWVVTSYGKVNQIIAVDKDADGFTLDDDTYFSGSWKDSYHLWTIQDAQPGDVLAITMYPEGTWVGIFKELTGCTFSSFSSYCFVNTEGIFKLGIYHDGKGMHPATKEQRDLLFQKMKESGFKWENSQLEEINDEGFVDLGLPSGTLWSKCNLGAEKETDFGLFYQWGDTQGYDGEEGHNFSWDTYKWGKSDNLDKYNNSDYKTNLDNEDDPVFAATNGMFKMPTKEQLQELINHTNYEWIENFEGSGVKGMKFTNKSDDTKYIFIPAAGFCGNGSHDDVGSWGIIWSDSCYEYGANYAWNMNFSVDYAGIDYFHRCDGFSVRGVVSPKTEMSKEP